MLLILGLLVGSFVATIVDFDIEDSNFVAPAMLFVSMGVYISAFFIGMIVGFSLISISKKFARLDKIETAIINAKTIKHDRMEYLAAYLVSFAASCFVLAVGGNLDIAVTLILTFTLFGCIIHSYLRNSKNTNKDRNRIILAIFLIFAATTLTVTRVNNLNIFVLFYGFITVPSYILPNLTYKLDRSDSALKGLSFSLSTPGAVANGIVLAQALVSGSQKDTIGTLINTYIEDQSRVVLVVVIMVVLIVYRSTKEYREYYNNAPTVVSNARSKTNNKFALFSIISGAVIAVTQYNPMVFVVTTTLGIICTYLVRNNDVLRSLCVPNLLISGLMFS